MRVKFEFSVWMKLQKTWCVAKPSSDQATLLANINYACSQVDCRILHKGCPCFSPDNLISHASIAMNLYYQCRGRNRWNCDFKNSALIVITDPSKSKLLSIWNMTIELPIFFYYSYFYWIWFWVRTPMIALFIYLFLVKCRFCWLHICIMLGPEESRIWRPWTVRKL